MSNHLFVGIDVSTSPGNVAAFLDSDGQRANKDLPFANNQSGAESFISTLLTIATSSNTDAISIGLEATGIYSWHLQNLLSSHPGLSQFKLKVYQINPKLTRNFKKAYPSLSKTDPIDAFVIADRVRFGRLPAPVNNDYTYLSLQRLTRYRFHLMQDIAREKSRFGNQAALAKFAGLWWKKHQSGNFEAEETRLAKSGNKYLRYYLVEAANLLMIHNPDFKAYYTKKYSEVPKHQHKRALVLCARKLVRVIFSLLRSKKLYELPMAA